MTVMNVPSPGPSAPPDDATGAMRVLVADDDSILRLALCSKLARWGFVPVATADGLEAWNAMTGNDSPPIAIIDWQMPGRDGPALCRELRRAPSLCSTYVILLTANARQQDVVAGLESGADEYITKPFDWNELRARLSTGSRIIGLQRALQAHVSELQQALSHVRRLHGLLPICAYCKRIRKEKNYWQQIELYISERSEAEFTHGICPECADRHCTDI